MISTRATAVILQDILDIFGFRECLINKKVPKNQVEIKCSGLNWIRLRREEIDFYRPIVCGALDSPTVRQGDDQSVAILCR